MVRTILTADKNYLQILLPDEYIGKMIEILAFPLENQVGMQFLPSKNKKKRITVATVIDKSYKFNRAELYDR
jgi:hypothetical protein